MFISVSRNRPSEVQPAAGSRVFSNFLAVGFGETVGRLLSFGGMLYAARSLGPTSYGVLAFVSGVTLYLSKVADFGIETVGTDEIAHRRHEIPKIGSAILGTRLALAAGLVVLATVLVKLFLEDPERTVFAVYFLTLLPIAASTKWIHMGLEAARPVGLWRVVGEAVTLGLIIAFARSPEHIWRVPTAILIGDSLVALALFTMVIRQGYPLSVRWNLQIAIPVFKRALPGLGVFLAGLLMYNLEIVFLRFMRSTESVGLYAAAYSLIGFISNVITAYGLTLLPTLTRLVRRSSEERHLYHTALAQVFALTLPIAVGGLFVAHKAIMLGFGEGYAPSALILQILVWTVPLYALRAVSWIALVAHRHQGLALRAMIYSVFANALLSLVLIHFYGMAGAAASSIITEALAGALTLYYALNQGLSFAALARFWRPVVAVLIMSAALWLSRDAHLVLQLGAGVAAYGLTLLFIGGIKLTGRTPALAV
jgi:O-antigen/teichoic acid export membrane protein